MSASICVSTSCKQTPLTAKRVEQNVSNKKCASKLHVECWYSCNNIMRSGRKRALVYSNTSGNSTVGDVLQLFLFLPSPESHRDTTAGHPAYAKMLLVPQVLAQLVQTGRYHSRHRGHGLPERKGKDKITQSSQKQKARLT